VSRKHTTGQAGKGRPTPPRAGKGPKGRATATRSAGGRSTTGPVYRQRRHAPLPVALKAGLAVVWLAALAAVVSLIDQGTARVGFMIVVTMVLVLFVVLVFNPSRRRSRR
jgi:peptidoglycan/LPS O-acetylase OafA/YrhL